MASLSLKIRPGRPNNAGRYPIFVSVIHNGAARFIPTPFDVAEPSQFSNGRITTRGAGEINKSLSFLLDEYRNKLARLDLSKFATASQLKEALTNQKQAREKPLTVAQMFANRIEQMKQEGRHSYASMLQYSAKVIGDIMGNPFVKDLTRQDIRALLDAMRARGYASGNIQMRLTHFKAAVNDLIDRELIRYDVHPFRGVKIPQAAPKYTDVSRADFQRIRALVPDCKRLELGRNMWLLSFYLCGLNLVDLTRLGQELRGQVLRFERQKTSEHTNGGGLVSFRIPTEARPLIEWADTAGIFRERTQTEYKTLQRYVNRCIALVADRVGIRGSFSYYSARHTFAELALLSGIHLELIEYLLGHTPKSNRPIYSYVHIMQSQADAALSHFFDWLNADI